MRAAAADIVRRLRAAGHAAWFVGGCVRDLLLGKQPDDYDVATSALPPDVEALFADTRAVGRAFGVVQVRSGVHWFEVATFRTEGPYTDGRRPDSVAFTDARHDALRRDFTVNALFQDPETGEVLDFVDGRSDLAARRLRAVGDPAERFAEDALRLLRAVRFACRLDFEIEATTWDAMCAHAARLAGTSAERVRDEFLGILTGPRPRRGLELLEASGLLAVFAPELLPLRGCAQSPRHHPEGDVWEHTLRMLDAMRDPDEILALSVLLHDVGKPAARTESDGEVHFYGHDAHGVAIARRMLERWRLSGHTQEAVLSAIGQHMQFLNTPRMRRSTLRRFVLQEGFPNLLELHRLDAVGARGDLTTWNLCRDELQVLAREAPPVRPLLDGHALMALGLPPGPRLGAALHALVDAQLEGQVRDRDAAEAWVRRWVEAEPPLDKPEAKSPP